MARMSARRDISPPLLRYSTPPPHPPRGAACPVALMCLNILVREPNAAPHTAHAFGPRWARCAGFGRRVRRGLVGLGWTLVVGRRGRCRG